MKKIHNRHKPALGRDLTKKLYIVNFYTGYGWKKAGHYKTQDEAFLIDNFLNKVGQKTTIDIVKVTNKIYNKVKK